MHQSEVIMPAYEGYVRSKLLWHGSLMGLKQWSVPNMRTSFELPTPLPRLRLGKWVERFFAYQLMAAEGYSLLEESLQIRQQKRTLGELDFLFLDKSQAVHLECVYKFYLYDHTKLYEGYLEPWIGPNRSDTLILKLNKLVNKQIPFINHSVTQEYLRNLGYRSSDFKQYVNFKAQLFLPLKRLDLPLQQLNKACVRGFHCCLTDLYQFNNFEIYIPSKLEWLVIPHIEVCWLSFEVACKKIEDQCAKHRSPMIWLKDPANHLQQAFVTWW